MKKLATLALSFAFCGCAQTSIQKAAADARAAIKAYKDNKVTIDEVMAKVVAVTPQTGMAHTIASDAVSATALVAANQGSIDAVDSKLALIDGSQ